jgi:5-methylcytosine-specific restriction protein A
MILLRTGPDTLDAVLREAKHALHGRPQGVSPGDIILIAQLKGTLRPGQKPIRWIMEYVDAYEDKIGESEQIFGRPWRYIIEGRDVRNIEPFDIADIQVTNKCYGPGGPLCHVEAEDEAAVLGWIGADATNP